MTEQEIKDLKIKHNKMMEECQPLYDKINDMVDEINKMRNTLMEAEGDDYDGIPLIFGCGYDI